MGRMSLDPLSGRTVEIEFGPEAKGSSSADTMEVTLYPGGRTPSKVRMLTPPKWTLDATRGSMLTFQVGDEGLTVDRATDGYLAWTLDTPITLAAGEYTLAFDPACTPSIICTDAQGNQYKSNLKQGGARKPYYTPDIAQYIKHQKASHLAYAKQFRTDLEEGRIARMREDIEMSKDWAEYQASPTLSSPTLTEHALREWVEQAKGE